MASNLQSCLLLLHLMSVLFGFLITFIFPTSLLIIIRIFEFLLCKMGVFAGDHFIK